MLGQKRYSVTLGILELVNFKEWHIATNLYLLKFGGRYGKNNATLNELVGKLLFVGKL